MGVRVRVRVRGDLGRVRVRVGVRVRVRVRGDLGRVRVRVGVRVRVRVRVAVVFGLRVQGSGWDSGWG